MPPLVLSSLLSAGCADSAGKPRDVFQGDPAQGLEIMREVGCAACHRTPGVVWPRGRTAGDLSGFGARPMIAGRLPNQPDVLMRWIVDAPSLDPSTGMPPMPMTNDQARDVAAYLYTLNDR